MAHLWHGWQKFKGVLLLASTYMRHVAASGLLPEPHDLNVCSSPCSAAPASELAAKEPCSHWIGC